MGKIIKNGIDYGGGVAVDSTLDTTSMNAIANKPVAEAITQLNNDLTDIREEMQNMGVPNLDYSNPLKVFNNSSSLTYTVSQECYLMGTANMNVGNGGVGTVKINNITIVTVGPIQNAWANNFPMQVSPMKLNSGDIVVVSHVCDGLSIFKPL